jgi:hypothetical protein
MAASRRARLQIDERRTPSLDWIAHEQLSRDALRELLMASYVALLDKACKLDPDAGRVDSEKASRRRATGG